MSREVTFAQGATNVEFLVVTNTRLEPGGEVTRDRNRLAITTINSFLYIFEGEPCTIDEMFQFHSLFSEPPDTHLWCFDDPSCSRSTALQKKLELARYDHARDWNRKSISSYASLDDISDIFIDLIAQNSGMKKLRLDIRRSSDSHSDRKIFRVNSSGSSSTAGSISETKRKIKNRRTLDGRSTSGSVSPSSRTIPPSPAIGHFDRESPRLQYQRSAEFQLKVTAWVTEICEKREEYMKAVLARSESSLKKNISRRARKTRDKKLKISSKAPRRRNHSTKQKERDTLSPSSFVSAHRKRSNNDSLLSSEKQTDGISHSSSRPELLTYSTPIPTNTQSYSSEIGPEIKLSDTESTLTTTSESEDWVDPMTKHIRLNTMYQEVYKKLLELPPFATIPQKLDVNRQILRISRDFSEAMSTVGRIIIYERFLNDVEKTIKPVSLGGILGGKKYIVHGILFKFAVGNDGERNQLDDFILSKIAGHELKSLSRLIDCNEKELYLPFMAVIDYLGYKLTAMTCLPVNDSSLKVGTANAGKTFYFDDKDITQSLQSIGDKLNLRSHRLSCVRDVKISWPADLEGHLGSDNRRYLLDTSRVFPPCHKTKSNSHLHELFRPEFVKKYHTPLCSDGHSGFMHRATSLLLLPSVMLLTTY